MVGTRDTPKDLEDAPDYSTLDRGNREKNLLVPSGGVTKDENYIKLLARNAYDSSTNWLNAGRRIAWNDSLRAFQGQHMTNSKYLSTDYRYRSRLFRPKTRAMVRKSEAQTAAAFFGNEDVCNIMPTDDDNPKQRASAAILKSLVQYRLTKTIPWFLTLVGGRQDAEVMGIALGKAYWKFQEKYRNTIQKPAMHPVFNTPMVDPDTGEPINDEFDVYETTTDHPWIDLLAPENFRFDPGADWRNPVATSPYVIELIPMYITDVKQKIKHGEWLPVSDGSLRNSTDLDDDVTRRSREFGRVPGKDHDAWKPRDYDICWIRENILRIDGEDMHCYTLASAGELLSKPRPAKEVYLQGTRPYVCGFVVPEAHKTYPTSKVEMVKDLQQQANDIVNLRLDNVKLALNPRQIVREGKGIDPTDVRNFQPGKVIMAKDPEADIKWDRPPEVTASSYQEQDRINLDFDDLTGDISNGSMQGNQKMYEAVGNMTMLQGNASQIGEYEQRCWAETFVEPLLTQLVKLEQAYETDEVVIANAGREAQLFQKFGIDQVTDELLQQELTVKVNVGLGATNPQMKLKNFMTATEAVGKMFGPAAAMSANPVEVIKEVFGLCGYKDGDRFFMPGADIHAMMQQMAQDKANEKKGGKDAAADQHEELMAQQAEAQRQQQEHQLSMQEMQMKYGLEEKKAAFDANLKEREFQRDSQMQQGKLQMDHQFRLQSHQDKMQDVVQGRQQQLAHEEKIKTSSSPEKRHDEIKEITGSIHHLANHFVAAHEHHSAKAEQHEKLLHMLAGNMHSNAKHSEHLTKAVAELAKFAKAKRVTRATRDERGKISGSESHITE